MVKFNQDTKDQSTEPLSFTNRLLVASSPSPPLLVSCENILYSESSEIRKIPILIPQTFISPVKECFGSDSVDNSSVSCDQENSHDDLLLSNFYNNKESDENIFLTNRVTDNFLSNDSFQNQCEDSFDFDWSESDCSLTPLFPESENLPCISTGKEERDQIDGVEFVSFETERDMVEYAKIELDFKGVAAASQSDDGLEMLDDCSFSDFNSTHSIIPTKTNDITKIKGWMNKRFAVSSNSDDDDSTTSRKSDDGYDDGFESSCMRNVEEASSEDRESTKLSDKLDTLLDTNEVVLAETKLCSLDETSTSKLSQNTVSPDFQKFDTIDDNTKCEDLGNTSLLSLQESPSSSVTTDSRINTITETSLQSTNYNPAISNSGSNSFYTRRVSQSLIDTISNKIKYNCPDEEQNSSKRTFSEAFNTEFNSSLKKPNLLSNKPQENLTFSRDMEQTSTDSKSAFVSDALDEFLKNQSKLNIHYELPKLKAAENITHSEEDVMPVKPLPVISRPRVVTKPIHINGHKPKTLAEMRMLLEKEKRTNLIGESSSSNKAVTSKLNPIVTKRKRSRTELIKLNKEIKDNFVNNKEMKQLRSSYETRSKNEASNYNKERFRSCRKSVADILKTLDSPSSSDLEDHKIVKKKIEPNVKNKSFDKATHKKFKKAYFGNYGEIKNCSPVSLKKRLSQNLHVTLDNCDEEIKTYDKHIFSASNLKNKVGMILHVGLGRPLYQEAAHNLELLRNGNAKISEHFASFAASAVLPNDSETVVRGTKVLVPVVCKKLIDLMVKTNPKLKTNNVVKTNITFPITNKITMQKNTNNKSLKTLTTKQHNNTTTTSSFTQSVVESSSEIRSLMNDMLRYVSNKDLFETSTYNFDPDVPIKEDTEKSISEEDKRSKVNKQKDNSLLNRQLKKIGVFLIDVTEESKNEEESQDECEVSCSKEFCKLGCICDSLKVKDRQVDHCQKVVCMFQCKCPKSTISKSMVEIKSRLWLSANVMHMRHENKLNLAKEEREYHHTVIKDRDKVIMLTGSKNKKREIKLPVKYRDSEVFLGGKEFSEEQLEKAFNSSINYEPNIKNKKVLTEEQKKKVINKKTGTGAPKNQTISNNFQLKPCSVVLDKTSISDYNNKTCKSFKILNPKIRQCRRNVAVKRTAPLTKNNFSKNKRHCSGLKASPRNGSNVILLPDSSDDDDDEKIENSEQPSSVDKHNSCCVNESTAPLPKISEPSRYLVIELIEDLFSLLRCKKKGVMVSYNNLKEAILLAESSNKTIRIIFPILEDTPEQGDDANKYSAYAVPGFKKDMIFFGPYKLNEDHGFYGVAVIEGKVVTVPFVKKDSHERNECGIRYLWWEKKFQETTSKKNSIKIKATETSLLQINSEDVIEDETTSSISDGSIEKKLENVESKNKKRITEVHQGKQNAKKKRCKKITQKKKKENLKSNPSLIDASTVDPSFSDHALINNQPLVKSTTSSEGTSNTKAVPLIRVRSDLMAVTPPKEEIIKNCLENETVKCVSENEIQSKSAKPKKNKRTFVTKCYKKKRNNSELMEAVKTVSRRFVEDISDSSSDSEESDRELDIFLFQPIGAVQNDITGIKRKKQNRQDPMLHLSEKLFKDPLESDPEGPLPESALLCLTPGIGYIPIVSAMNSHLAIKDPTDNLELIFFSIPEASKYLNKLFRDKMTFESEDVNLKWVLVKAPIIKRLRPFDPDILTTSSLIVTQDGVLEEHTHALNIERNLREKRRRRQLCMLARVLGKLFVDDNQLERMSLKSILETAVSIIQKVNEISLNYVDILNQETAKKARLESRLKALRAELFSNIYKQNVNTATEKEQILPTINISEEDVLSEDTVIIMSDKEDDIEIISPPENVSVNKRRQRKRRRSKVVEILDSSEDENANFIEVSDSDSDEITCLSSKDDRDVTMQPVSPESNFAARITPVLSSPSSNTSKPASAIQSPVHLTEQQVTVSFNQAVEHPKPSWYIAPEASPPPSSVPSVIPQSVNPSIAVSQSANRPTIKTVLVRKDAKGVVHLFAPKAVPKVTADSRFVPVVQSQSILCKNLQKGTNILNKAQSSTVVGTVSVERRNRFVTEGKPSTRVVQVCSSILKNNNPVDKNLPKTDGFVKVKCPVKVPVVTNNSSSDDSDSVNLLPYKVKVPLTNMSVDCLSANSSSLSSSSRDDTTSQSPNTSYERNNQTLMDSVVLKGPKLRFPKNSSKGVKVLRPVEKH